MEELIPGPRPSPTRPGRSPDHLLGGAGDEIGDQRGRAAIPRPAKRIPVCPVAPNAASSRPAAAARVISSAAVILPTLQSLPTVRTTNGRG